MQCKIQSVELVPQILHSVQEMFLEIWRSTVFYQVKRITRFFLWLSLTLEVQYIMLYRVNYLKSIVTLSFSNYTLVSTDDLREHGEC